MTDLANQESCPVPDPTIVDPCPVRNGHGFTNNHHPQAKSPGQPEAFTTGQEMRITDSVEGEGNFDLSKLMDLCIFVRACVRVGYFYPLEVFIVADDVNNLSQCYISWIQTGKK